MFHSSRTTLKELKKRYLNILKKCMLINLAILSALFFSSSKLYAANLYGGINGAVTDVDESKTSITLNVSDNANYGRIIGGNYTQFTQSYATGDFTYEFDSINTNLNNVTVSGEVVGGSRHANGFKSNPVPDNTRLKIITEETNLVINGGIYNDDYPLDDEWGRATEAYNNVVTPGNYIKDRGYNVSYAPKIDFEINNATLTITNGTFDSFIHGGSILKAYCDQHVDLVDSIKNATINISGGQFNQNIYAGGSVLVTGYEFSNDITNENKIVSQVEKSTINISGGNFASDIYAGGLIGIDYPEVDKINMQSGVSSTILNIENVSVNNIYGNNALGTFIPNKTTSNESWDIQKGSSTLTHLTMTDASAKKIEILNGSLTLKSFTDNQMNIESIYMGNNTLFKTHGNASIHVLNDIKIEDNSEVILENKGIQVDGSISFGNNVLLKIILNTSTIEANSVSFGTGNKLDIIVPEELKTGEYDFIISDNISKISSIDIITENLLYDFILQENGKIFVKAEDTNKSSSISFNSHEQEIFNAINQSNDTLAQNELFEEAKSSLLKILQSTDQREITKAKKALKAVGTSEQPVSASLALNHFNELTRVISQMAMEKEAEFGHSGGDTDPRAKVYIKGLYDRTKSSMGEGFRARSKGAVLGVQSEVTEALTLGVGYATSQTTAKEDLRRTEVDTNTGFISAHYQPNAWWVSGLATFSRGEYEEEKQILSSMGKATYDVDSWGAQVMTGYDIKLENAIITPEVGMRYLSVKQEGYTDTLGTTVSGTRSDYLTALVGVKGTWDMGAIRPTAGVTVGYDIISDDVSALNTLANGASYTVNGEALDRLSTGVSLGVEAGLGERTTLKLEYSGTFRKEYADHSGMLKLEMKF
ncbi:MAG: autotransporter outer membrane beta-barrel domain-containing protein [Alphaproteobacteria bacterium]|nr:autotransporter outer membrane beta-barrel domain-containing protein [Alphaproteobacteria bacterium]